MASMNTTTSSISLSKIVENTPISKGDKREASSPLDAQDSDAKKIRHKSDGSIISSADNIENETGVDDSVHMHLLTQPMNPGDIVQIAFELRSVMLPEISCLIQNQLPDIRNIITEAVTAATVTLKAEISSLKEENRGLREENAVLRENNKSLLTRVTKMEIDTGALEQYTRRNSVRISGISEENNENTDDIVMKLSDSLTAQINLSDIDRSHRVGKPNDTGPTTRPRDILVKFATYNARQRLFSKRKTLRDKEDMKCIYINEDLTKFRSKLLFNARTLVRAELLKSAYTTYGKIFVHDKEDGRHLIRSRSDILKFGDSDEASVRRQRHARR